MGVFEFIGGAVGGATSAVDKFLGGTGGEPMTPTQAAQAAEVQDFYGGGSTTTDQGLGAGASGAGIPDMAKAAGYEPEDVDRGVVDEHLLSGSDREIPSTGVDSIKEVSTSDKMFSGSTMVDDSAITRADYTKMADIGDSKTQALIKSGLDPLQALDQQKREAESRGDTRSANYYQNEWDKAAESNVAISSAYHHAALESGLPQAVNPFEYAGDISALGLKSSQAKQWIDLERAEGKSTDRNAVSRDVNELALNIGAPQGLGGSSQRGISDFIASIKGEGQLGPYGYLGQPTYGKGEQRGILSLAEQQAIGEQAARSSAAARGMEGEYGGWEIKPGAMKAFTPTLAKGLGFGKGAESVAKIAMGESAIEPTDRFETKITATEKAVAISEKPGEVVGISSDIVPKIVGGGIGAGIGTLAGGPVGTVIGGVMGSSPTGRSATENIGKNISGLFAEKKVEKVISPIIETPTKSKGTTVEVIVPEGPAGRSFVGGVTGLPDTTLADYKLENILVPLGESSGAYGRPPSMLENINAGRRTSIGVISIPRKSKPSHSSIKRQTKKSDPKVIDVTSLSKLASGSLNISYKTPSLESAIKSVDGSSIKTKVNISSKSTSIPTLKSVGNKQRKKDISNNIANMVGNITKSTKIKKIKVK